MLFHFQNHRWQLELLKISAPQNGIGWLSTHFFHFFCDFLSQKLYNLHADLFILYTIVMSCLQFCQSLLLWSVIVKFPLLTGMFLMIFGDSLYIESTIPKCCPTFLIPPWMQLFICSCSLAIFVSLSSCLKHFLHTRIPVVLEQYCKKRCISTGSVKLSSTNLLKRGNRWAPVTPLKYLVSFLLGQAPQAKHNFGHEEETVFSGMNGFVFID